MCLRTNERLYVSCRSYLRDAPPLHTYDLAVSVSLDLCFYLLFFRHVTPLGKQPVKPTDLSHPL